MKGKFNHLGKEYNPETLALGLGYDAFLSEGAIKPPVFMTSTFKFRSAEEGKHFFDIAYGKVAKVENEIPGLVYSRLNNPNLEIFEERISAWDGTERAAVFSSGMSAISGSILAFVKPGEHILCTLPVYGGTYYFFQHILPKFGIQVHMVAAGDRAKEEFERVVHEVGPEKFRVFYLETPANPSNILTDIQSICDYAKELNNQREQGHEVITMVDNTFLGPIFQKPAKQGADLVIYSATKFIGGHSDLVAGVVSGKAKYITDVMVTRTFLGTMVSPFTSWLLLRSLETLSIRMQRACKNAQKVAEFLAYHPQVFKVSYPGLLKEGENQYQIFKKQCSGAGSLISFDVKGGQNEAFKVLNNFRVFGLAVSLGGTESLVEHPQSMTHADVPGEELHKYGVSEGTIRVSVGIEHVDDLVEDIHHALKVLH